MTAKSLFQKAICLFLLVLLLLSTPPTITSQAQETFPDISNYYFHNSWGGEGKQLLNPIDVALSPNGKIYIVNNEYNRITIVDNDGYIYNEIGGGGIEDGKFDSPRAIAINDIGEIFVADTFNRRLQKFDSAGNHLLTFGTFGQGEGEIFAPQGIAFAANSDLLVVDGLNKVLRYTQNGEFVAEWGKDYSSSEPNANDLNYPSDVAVDNDGNIYIADSGNYRIQIYDPSGIYINTINILDGGSQVAPKGVALDNSGKLYITGNDKIFIYDTSNLSDSPITWGGSGTELGLLGGATGIFIDKISGDIYVAEETNNRVTIFNSNGQVLTTLGKPGLVDGYFYFPQDVTIVNDNVYITDMLNNRIQVFNLDGTFVNKWGTLGNSNGQFDEPLSIDSDTEGYIYITDSNNLRVQKFDSSGNWLKTYDLLDHYPSECKTGDLICTPNDITIDQNDTLFITINSIEGAHGILKLSNSGNLLDLWPVDGSSIATDSIGNVYTTWGGYIFKYRNEDGELLNTFGEGPGPNKGYRGLEVDQFGNIFTMNTWLSYLIQFSSQGNLLGTFGQKGNDPGQFFIGSQMAITNDGTIYIADVENQRVQVIAPSLPDPDPDSGLVLNGNFNSLENKTYGEQDILKDNISNKTSQSNRSSIPGLDHWVYGGDLPINRSDLIVNQSMHSLQLGEDVSPVAQGISEAWIYQSIYVLPEWRKPILTFNYKVITNDSKSSSNFIAEIQDGVGLNNLEIIVLDGFEGATSSDIPTPATDLGWKSIELDLSAYQGQHIRLAFGNRNLYPNSLGIWSYIEKIEVKDKVDNIYLPLIFK